MDIIHLKSVGCLAAWLPGSVRYDLVLYPWGVMGMMLLPYVTGGASSVNGAFLELAAIGGLVLAAVVKWGLKRAWHRLDRAAGAPPRRPGVRSPLSKCRTLPVR